MSDKKSEAMTEPRMDEIVLPDWIIADNQPASPKSAEHRHR